MTCRGRVLPDRNRARWKHWEDTGFHACRRTLKAMWKDLSYRLNSLQGVIWGIIWGTSIWLIKGDTKSLDYGACAPLSYPARNRAQLSSTSSRAVTVGTGCGEQGFPRNKFKERFLGYRFLRVATHQIRKWRGADL